MTTRKPRSPRKPARRGATQTVDVPAYAAAHPNYVTCRVWSHPWVVAGALEYRNGQVIWTLACTRCGAAQEMHTGRRTGEVEYRKYQLSEGYLWEGVGQQKPKVGELRVALAGVLKRKKS